MTDLELAEEIGGMIFDAIKHGDEKHQAWLHDKSHELAPQLIAALRRGPEHEGLYEKLWKDFVSLQRGDAQGILAKVEAYYRERPPSGEMVAMRKVRKVLVNFDIEAAVDDYEFRGDEGDYTPNEKERVLLTDFAHGFIGELCEALGKLSAAEAKGRKS